MNLGGIEIERAWLEYEFAPELVVRAGQWLTPYGIWNVDHGTPTVIAVYRPYSIGEQLFPERQAGFQVWGRVAFDAFDLNYYVTLSNGRGPYDAYLDFDSNKAVGGRLMLERMGDLQVRLGLSAYYGRYTDEAQNISIDPDVAFVANPEIVEQYDELGLAADLRLRLDGVLVQAEFISTQRRYTEAGRPRLDFRFDRLEPDRFLWGGYILLCYDTGLWGLRPYVMLERNEQANFISHAVSMVGGINARAHARVTLKAQATLHLFNVEGGGQQRVLGLDMQVAWAF